MDGDPSGVERGDARWCQDDVTLVRAGGEAVQEGGLTRARLSREEDVAVGAVDEPGGQRGHLGLHVGVVDGTCGTHFTKVGSAHVMRKGHASWLNDAAPVE